MKRHACLLLLALICQLPTAHCQADRRPLPNFLTDSLDAYVARGLREWQIPGCAVAVVKDGNIVLAKGFGVRELGKPEKVDENTLFMIGSNTKAFTATALAMLEAEGKLSLNDPVTKHLPEFKLHDPCATQQATLTDLLCHRLGLRTFQGDFTYWTSDLTRKQVMQKFGLVVPPYGFRTRYGYCNAGFLTAGEVVPVAGGVSWEAFVRERIFNPLRMNRALALSAEMPNAENKAASHTWFDGKLVKLPYPTIDNLAPAGSIAASAREHAHWLLMQLDTGKFEGKQVVPKSAILKTWTPQTIVNTTKSSLLPSQFGLYGLGWFVQDYAGRRVIAHTGGVDGFVTSTCLVPEERLGILVFTNTDANAFFDALRLQIQDAFLNQPYQNYHGLFLKNFREEDRRERERLANLRAEAARKPTPALPLTAYAGRYENPVYGFTEIKPENGALVLTFEHHPNLRTPLQPLGENRFLAPYPNPTMGVHPLPFKVENGKVVSMDVKVNDFVEYGSYVFSKE